LATAEAVATERAKVLAAGQVVEVRRAIRPVKLAIGARPVRQAVAVGELPEEALSFRELA